MNGTDTSKLSSLKVLMVEDNLVNQKVTSAMLKHFGIESDIAENGQEAVDMVQQKSYDIIFMDCQMPVMNGFDATREIRKQEGGATSNTVPILAMTANASPDAVSECYDSGMNDVIAKPVELGTLGEMLNKWCSEQADQ